MMPLILQAPPMPLAQRAKALGLRMPLRRVFLRAFKREGRLELWAANGPGRMTLLRDYPIAAMSGTLGPKRREGDPQVPEGFYSVVRFNPKSQYHLSLGLDYPNRSDRVRGDRKRPGSDIYIHGKAVSAGCLAMTDPVIDELYPALFNSGNRRTIRVHLFPFRMTRKNLTAFRGPPSAFWQELRPIYSAFESSHVVPDVGTRPDGAYYLR